MIYGDGGCNNDEMVIYGSSDNNEVLHDVEVKLVVMKIIVVFFFNFSDFVLLQP